MARKGLGQDKRGRSAKDVPPARLFLRTMQTPAWRALSPYAQRLYPWLQLEWSGPKENNNGKIRFSVRQAADALGCNPETARKALADLQRKGFLVVRRCATLGTDGEARGHEYELTEFDRPGEHREYRIARRLFDQWQPGKDFDVVKAAVHNPTGKGGLKFRTLTYDVSPAQLTGPEGPNLQRKSKGAKKDRFPTYAISHPNYQGGVGEMEVPILPRNIFATEPGDGNCPLLKQAAA